MFIVATFTTYVENYQTTTTTTTTTTNQYLMIHVFDLLFWTIWMTEFIVTMHDAIHLKW